MCSDAFPTTGIAHTVSSRRLNINAARRNQQRGSKNQSNLRQKRSHSRHFGNDCAVDIDRPVPRFIQKPDHNSQKFPTIAPCVRLIVTRKVLSDITKTRCTEQGIA